MRPSLLPSYPSKFLRNSCPRSSRLLRPRHLSLLSHRTSLPRPSCTPARFHRPRPLTTTPHRLDVDPPATHVREPTPLSQEVYHTHADAYIDTLVAELEELQELREEVDVEYSVRTPGSLSPQAAPSSPFLLLSLLAFPPPSLPDSKQTFPSLILLHSPESSPSSFRLWARTCSTSSRRTGRSGSARRFRGRSGTITSRPKGENKEKE